MSRVCKIARRPAKRARSYFCAANCCISREDEVPHPLLCIFKITKTNFGVTILLHIFVASSFSHTSWFVFVDLHGPVWTEKKRLKARWTRGHTLHQPRGVASRLRMRRVISPGRMSSNMGVFMEILYFSFL